MSVVLPLRLSSISQEGAPSFSKWLKVQLLIDDEEMADLLKTLSPVEICSVGSIVEEHSMVTSHETFLQAYIAYIRSLKAGEVPDDVYFRRCFSALLTREKEALYAQEVSHKKYLVRSLRPTIQLQAHSFFLSSVDGKFYPMVLSQESISWGIQCSYPQIFQEAKSADFKKVNDLFPNTALFQGVIHWMRKNTIATPFVYKGVLTNVPMRLGKKCFSWISAHSGLKNKGLSIKPLEVYCQSNSSP